MAWGAISRRGRGRRKAWSKAWRRGLDKTAAKRGRVLHVRVWVSRSPYGPGELFLATACPGKSQRISTPRAGLAPRCGVGRGGTPTAAAKKALRAMTAKLR